MKYYKLTLKLFAFTLIALLQTACSSSGKDSNETTVISEVQFNLKNVPFSTKGAGLALSYNKRNPGLGLNDISGNGHFSDGGLFSISILTEKDPIVPEANATASLLSITSNNKIYVEGCFESIKIFRLRGKDTPVLLNALPLVFIKRKADNVYHLTLNLPHGTSRYILSCLSGEMSFLEKESKFRLSPVEKEFEIRIEEADSTWQSLTSTLSFEECVKLTQQKFEEWLSKMPATAEKYETQRQLASYVLWSSTLDAGGQLKRSGMLMSKNHMHYIWSWDHCFNAMTCSYEMPDVAWNEFMVLFDNQDEKGQIILPLQTKI